MKFCRRCKRDLPLSDFWRSGDCKPCEREKRRGRGRELARMKILAAINKLGGKCSCCGEETPEFLTFDHIDGKDVSGHRTLTNYGVAIRILRGDNVDEIRIHCMNCNHSLGVRGYCPHRPFGRFGKLGPAGVQRITEK